MRLTHVASAALLGILSLAGTANAQSGSINVTANVLSPITVASGQALDFQNVTPGVPKTVAVTSGNAGRFDISAASSTPVSMTFVLPTDLTSGGNLLPIASWSGNHNTSNSPTGTGFTPSAGATGATTSATGQLFVFIGATVSPGAAQATGVYNGTVQMTVIY